MAGPYGRGEEVTIYVQKASDGSELNITDVVSNYNVDLALNKVSIFNATIDAVEEADKVFIDPLNYVFVFSGLRLEFAGRIQQVNYGNENSATLTAESLGDAKLIDRTTARLQFNNIDSCAINACLLCTGGSNIISMGTNTNFGKITFRNENDNTLSGLSKVAGSVTYDWWTANGSSTCQCVSYEGAKIVDDGNEVYNWTQAGGACTIGLDTNHKKEGYASLGMGGSSATTFTYTGTLNQAAVVMPYNNFQWWLYIDNIACFTTNPVRVCLYKASTGDGYFIDIACTALSNGWNLLGKVKADFTSSGASPTWNDIDTLRLVWCPVANCDIGACCLKMDYFLNYDYSSQFYNTNTARGASTTVINTAEATTDWSAICIGDSVTLNTTTFKCGAGSINFIKAQTGQAASIFQYAHASTLDLTNKSVGFWFYLDCATCAKLHTTAPLELRMCKNALSSYKSWTWDCKDLCCGWNLLIVDTTYPETLNTPASFCDAAIDRFRWIITTCAAACVFAAGTIMVDQLVYANYGLSFGGKYINATSVSNQEDTSSLANKIIILGAGDGNNQICSVSLGATTIRSCLCFGETQLCENITATAASIGVFDTTGYPTAGCVCIDAECISYTGKTATCFTGATRGLNSTCCLCHTCLSSVLGLTQLEVFSTTGFTSPASCICVGMETIGYTGVSGTCFTGLTRGLVSTKKYAHGKCIEVYDGTYTCTSCQAGSSIAVNGLKEVTITCPGILDQNLADRAAQTYLINHCSAPSRIIATPISQDFFSRVELGDAVIVDDKSASTQSTYRLVRIRNMGSMEEGNSYEIELSNRRIEIVEELQRRACQINESTQYMQGATNVYQLQAEDNTDTGFGTVLKYYLPSDVKAINISNLSYDVGGYRTYSQTTGSCIDGSTTYMILSQDIENTSVTGCIRSAVTEPSIENICAGGAFSDHIWIYTYGNFHGASQLYTFQICDCTAAANILSTTCTLADSAIATIFVRDTTNRVGSCVGWITCCSFINDERYAAYSTRATHCHNVAYGITDTGSTVSAICILANGTDCSACFGALSTTQQNDLNLLLVPQLQTRGQWHCVEVRPTGRGRIRSNIYQKVYIESCT